MGPFEQRGDLGELPCYCLAPERAAMFVIPRPEQARCIF
jgi:hypothetical protein